ncbi:MAG TPA: hypothetical protein VGL72_17010 [Bryobacteraceae bacterium]|jgi:hypothetical protein
MRIIIANTKTVDETKRIVERSTEDLFRSAAGGVVQISDVKKNWNGNTMSFSFTAAVAFFTTPIEGTVAVTEKEVTIDVVLPEAFRKFLPEDKLKSGIESRVRGLLK